MAQKEVSLGRFFPDQQYFFVRRKIFWLFEWRNNGVMDLTPYQFFCFFGQGIEIIQIDTLSRDDQADKTGIFPYGKITA